MQWACKLMNIFTMPDINYSCPVEPVTRLSHTRGSWGQLPVTVPLWTNRVLVSAHTLRTRYTVSIYQNMFSSYVFWGLGYGVLIIIENSWCFKKMCLCGRPCVHYYVERWCISLLVFDVFQNLKAYFLNRWLIVSVLYLCFWNFCFCNIVLSYDRSLPCP